MTDGPFRDQRQCPSCKMALRDYGKRLVCDHCGGIQLPLADLVKSSEEIALAPVVVRFVDKGAAEPPCPHCGNPLIACRAEIDVDAKTLRLPTDLLRCDAHGPFFPQMSLTEFFATVEKRMHVGQIRGSH